MTLTVWPYALGLTRVRLSPVCVLCQSRPKRDPSAHDYLCQACHQDMAWLPHPMHLDLITGHELIVQHATTYTGAMRRAISSFKDRENLTTLPLFITALAQLAQILPADGVLLPMPTTNTRLKERGFAPVMLLSRYLATLTGLSIYQGLVRVQDTLHQRGLSRLDRLHNVANAFAVAYDPPADKIIIIDDVCTTGSTIKAAAETLYAYYGDEVAVAGVCLAHGHATPS